VVRSTQATAAVDLDGVGVGPLDLGPHLLEEADQVIHLGLPGRGPDDGVAVREGRCKNRVLRSHHRYEREPDLRSAKAARRRREVIAVAVLDRRSERPHRLDVKVDRTPPDPVAARVADDHPAEPAQQRTEQHERRPHLGRRLERDEQPVDVARRDLVDVRLGVVDDDAEVAERLGHDPDVLDLGHVGEPAALAGERRRGEHLQGRVLRAADRDLAGQGHAALDPEDLPGHRLRRELPVEGFRVSHIARQL